MLIYGFNKPLKIHFPHLEIILVQPSDALYFDKKKIATRSR
jgi:hypothetical protein